MTKKNWAGFEVVPGEPRMKKQGRKRPPEKRIHIYMDWPESLKEEFDDLYYAKLRKTKKKNEILEQWCREGIAKLRD